MISVLFSSALCSLAVVCSMAAGVSAYLAAPRQLLLRKAVPVGAGLGLAAVLAGVALGLFCQVVGAFTAVFSLAVVLMSVWSLLPLCVALARWGQEPS
nr:hypothetical protein [uncultured Acetobacter sp.]